MNNNKHNTVPDMLGKRCALAMLSTALKTH